MTDTDRERGGLEPPVDADAVRDEQAERALRRLGEHGDLTPRQRATVERLADRLTTELLALFDGGESAIDRTEAGETEQGVVLSSD